MYAGESEHRVTLKQHEPAARSNESVGFLVHDLRNLVDTPIVVFDSSRSRWRVSSRTGAVLQRSLLELHGWNFDGLAFYSRLLMVIFAIASCTECCASAKLNSSRRRLPCYSHQQNISDYETSRSLEVEVFWTYGRNLGTERSREIVSGRRSQILNLLITTT